MNKTKPKTIEELFAETIQNSKLSFEELANATQEVWAKMLKPSKQAQEAMKKYGITMEVNHAKKSETYRNRA